MNLAAATFTEGNRVAFRPAQCSDRAWLFHWDAINRNIANQSGLNPGWLDFCNVVHVHPTVLWRFRLRFSWPRKFPGELLLGIFVSSFWSFGNGCSIHISCGAYERLPQLHTFWRLFPGWKLQGSSVNEIKGKSIKMLSKAFYSHQQFFFVENCEQWFLRWATIKGVTKNVYWVSSCTYSLILYQRSSKNILAIRCPK